MPDNPSKFQNIQPPTQPSDGLSSGIVETDSLTGGEIDGGPVTGAAKQGIEGLAAYMEDLRRSVYGGKISDYFRGVPTKRDLP